ncbi:hypothetical protein ACJMK2_024406 [Sinanodonta woodiana]|uniref:Uncharacterized protein n=1 Tax=Sinanodonta woodiana TaxID=1069815 RepID=A0ABD3T8A5_SINWO
MKGIIILAVTIFLVDVQATSISRVQKEVDFDESKTVESPWILEELDRTSANDALDELQNIKAMVDVLHFLRNYNDVMECSGNTCEWCFMSACIKVSFLANKNEFQFCASYLTINLYCLSVPARPYKNCKSYLGVDICLETTNVNISGGRACLDVTISVGIISKTFSKICMGP